MAASPARPPFRGRDFSAAGPGSGWLCTVCIGSRPPPQAPAGAGLGGTRPLNSLRSRCFDFFLRKPRPKPGGLRQNRPPTPRPALAAAPNPRRHPSSGPHPGPNSIAPGLMNSRALIGSPSTLWIYTCRLLSGCRRAPPRWLPKARASGLAREGLRPWGTGVHVTWQGCRWSRDSGPRRPSPAS